MTITRRGELSSQDRWGQRPREGQASYSIEMQPRRIASARNESPRIYNSKWDAYEGNRTPPAHYQKHDVSPGSPASPSIMTDSTSGDDLQSRFSPVCVSPSQPVTSKSNSSELWEAQFWRRKAFY